MARTEAELTPAELLAIANLAGTSIIEETPAGTIDGANKTFTISAQPATNGLFLYKNGILQKITTDYTLVGTTITFVSAPAGGSVLTAKIITGAGITGNVRALTMYFDSEYDNGNSGAAKIVDWRNGNKQKITTTGSCTLTFVAPLGPCNLQLKVVHEASATAYTYTYPGTVKWSGGPPPTTNTSGAVDIISFYYDGTNYYGLGTLNFS